jgi:hypothetical protein
VEEVGISTKNPVPISIGINHKLIFEDVDDIQTKEVRLSGFSIPDDIIHGFQARVSPRGIEKLNY